MCANGMGVNELLSVSLFSPRVVALTFRAIAPPFFAKAQLKGDSFLREMAFADGDGHDKNASGIDVRDILNCWFLKIKGGGDLGEKVACSELFCELTYRVARLLVDGRAMAYQH